VKLNKIILALAIATIFVIHLACAARWTEETARQEAFKNIQRYIDVSKYPAFDPNVMENQKAIREGRQRVANRFVTPNPEPPAGYVVSELNAKGYPRITMFYGTDGHLMSIREFSRSELPRTAYIYCINEKDCKFGNKEYKAGELISVSLHLSGREAFYFTPDGKLSGHLK